MVDIREWFKMHQQPAVKCEQQVISSLTTAHLVSRYMSTNKKHVSLFRELALSCQHKSILKCVELKQGISHLTIISDLEACTNSHNQGTLLTQYVDKNVVSQNTVCDWLMQLLSITSEMGDRFRKCIARMDGLYIQNGRIRIGIDYQDVAPPILNESDDSLEKLISWLLRHDNIRSKNFGSLALLMAEIGQLSVRNTQTVQKMLKKIAEYKKSDSSIIHLKNRRFVRKNSVEGSRNSQQNHPSVGNLNVSRCFRKISSSGVLSPYVGLKSPRQPSQINSRYASPIHHLLKINDKPDSSIRKINRLTLLKRQQHMFQSQKQIKSSESPERYDAQTDRAKPDSLPSTKALEAKAIFETPIHSQQKQRRPSRVQRKLIIRNPFKDKEQQQQLPHMEQSAIEKVEYGADASQQLNQLLQQIKNSSRDT